MEELYTAFKKAGGNLIGQVSGDDYIFDDSKSMIDGMFCGLPIDEDNESEKTQDRLEAWCQTILNETNA
jgi:flavodoxin I